ncbi:MAG: HNH endonuclease [Candidatus Eremiobacteraeota bacterium]|nr:HNH endonuclease [Candidatus Eremiobacteraeota bacterium]MCW5866425.1 HNH endonuclease [Candidatus Eremiobacteraeota bacterium]
MAAYRRLDLKRLAGITAALGAFLFRFGTVGQRRNNELETVLAHLAQAIHNGQIANVSGVDRSLAPLYPSDEQFLSDFKIWSVAATGPKKKLARFLLIELEALAAGTEVRYDPNSLTLEHILPVSQAGDGLENRFGNLALLEKTLNREAGSAPWPQKRAIYARSRLLLTRAIAAEEWNAKAIESRQEELAKLAARRFRMHSQD